MGDQITQSPHGKGDEENRAPPSEISVYPHALTQQMSLGHNTPGPPPGWLIVAAPPIWPVHSPGTNSKISRDHKHRGRDRVSWPVPEGRALAVTATLPGGNEATDAGQPMASCDAKVTAALLALLGPPTGPGSGGRQSTPGGSIGFTPRPKDRGTKTSTSVPGRRTGHRRGRAGQAIPT